MFNQLLKRVATAVAVLAIVATVSACSSAGPDAAASVSTVRATGLGEFLVDGNGMALYVFEPDEATTVSCTQACAAKWPPLFASKKELPEADGAARRDLLGTLPSPEGGDVVTYNGWPLYRYVIDRAAGEHQGQNVFLNGGTWYLMGIDGNPVSSVPNP